MRPALLIAGNFLREHRWAILLLLAFAGVSGIAAAIFSRSNIDDALFFLKQQAGYSVFFTLFLAASALHNQRRSRRILAVLSKGIERREYLAGIAIGYAMVSGLYSLILAATGAWIFALAGAEPVAILPLMLVLFIASVLAGTVALFFSTFLSPLFTLVGTSLVIGATAIIPNSPWFVPVYPLLHAVVDFSIGQLPPSPWTAVGYACVETVLFWLAASVIFGIRDVAVAVE